MQVETNNITHLKALIADLYTQNQQLQARVADLEARLAQNSTNSSKPLSSDGLAKKPLLRPALTNDKGKKHGGQAGHKGDTLRLVDTPNHIIVHRPAQCRHCGQPLTQPGQLIAKRQVFDLPQPKLEVTEHQLWTRTCRCGCVNTGQFPASVVAPVQYGPRIKATSLVLNADYCVRPAP